MTTVHQARGRWGEAADVHRALADRSPAAGRHAFAEGFAALNAGLFDQAAEAFAWAERMGRWVGWSVYYQGAVEAARGRPERALEELERALALGFDDARLLGSDRWWDPIRARARFRALATRIGPSL